jgi:hypothetical protein
MSPARKEKKDVRFWRRVPVGTLTVLAVVPVVLVCLDRLQKRQARTEEGADA